MVDIARNHRSTETSVGTMTPPLTAPMPAPAAGPHLAGAEHTAPTARVRPDDRGPMRPSTTEPSARAATAARYLLAGIRLALGWVFLWAFLDKAFGLGFATPSASAASGQRPRWSNAHPGSSRAAVLCRRHHERTDRWQPGRAGSAAVLR